MTTSVWAGNREIVFELLFDLNRFLHGNEADIVKLLEDIHSEWMNEKPRTYTCPTFLVCARAQFWLAVATGDRSKRKTLIYLQATVCGLSNSVLTNILCLALNFLEKKIAGDDYQVNKYTTIVCDKGK